MARTANDIGMPSDMTWPPPGTYTCECVAAEKWTSPKKGTKAVRLEFVSGEYAFEDLAFVSEKTIKRLNLIAQRLCGMPKETPLPDGNPECASFLAKYILEHAAGKRANVKVEEHTEEYMVETGPDAGQMKSKQRRRVAFSGYEIAQQFAPETPADGDIPF